MSALQLTSLSLLVFVVLNVDGYRSMTPQLDIINVPGDNPPYVPVKIGYPAQGPFNMALYLDYHTSWLYSSHNVNTGYTPINSKCFNEQSSSTFESSDKGRKQNAYAVGGEIATDLMRVGNNEYAFKFGLVHGKCNDKNVVPYSGVLGLAPQNENKKPDTNLNILSGLKGKTEQAVSFFIPSRYSQQQKRALIFGSNFHPACHYDSSITTPIRGQEQWWFSVRFYDSNPQPESTYKNRNVQNATISLDLEDIYGPAEEVFSIYRMLNAQPLEDGTDRYYIKCHENKAGILAFDLTETQDKEFRFYARHLVTPLDKNSNKCVVNVRTGGVSSNHWVFGKKFAERFCITINYDKKTLGLGTVYDISQYKAL